MQIQVEIDNKAIIRVCLLHDMGNIVKIPEDFSKEQEFLKIRKKYLDKYGTNAHEINLEIGKKGKIRRCKSKI